MSTESPPTVSHRLRVPRITVVGTVYYQPAFGDPTSLQVRYSLNGKTDEQPYSRSLRCGEDWQPLDYGWVKEPGCVVVNNEKVVLDFKPTDEQRAEISSKVIQLGVEYEMGKVVPCQDVFPGVGWPCTPPDFSLLRIRCLSGEARFSLTVFPK